MSPRVLASSSRVPRPAEPALDLEDPAPSLTEQVRGKAMGVIRDQFGKVALDVGLYGSEAFMGARAVGHLRGEYSPAQALGATHALYHCLEAQPDGAVFASDLEELGTSPRVKRYLDELSVISTGKRAAQGDLWSITMRHAGSRDEALRWLGTLFQDVSGRNGQLLHIADPGIRATLSDVLDTMGRGALGIPLYPEDTGIKDAQLYHYYVPAYAAAKMAKDGVDPKLAFSMPLLLNSEYELIMDRFPPDSGFDNMMAAGWDAFGRLWSGSPALQGRTGSTGGTLRDLYLGYRGALFGSGADATPVPFGEFQAPMAAHPDDELRALIRGV